MKFASPWATLYESFLRNEQIAHSLGFVEIPTRTWVWLQELREHARMGWTPLRISRDQSMWVWRMKAKGWSAWDVMQEK